LYEETKMDLAVRDYQEALEALLVSELGRTSVTLELWFKLRDMPELTALIRAAKQKGAAEAKMDV
jgi:hypothetical protein